MSTPDLIGYLNYEESTALDNPDRLFALGYLRSHVDLLIDQADPADLQGEIERSVQAAFAVDRMSELDKQLVLAELQQMPF